MHARLSRDSCSRLCAPAIHESWYAVGHDVDMGRRHQAQRKGRLPCPAPVFRLSRLMERIRLLTRSGGYAAEISPLDPRRDVLGRKQPTSLNVHPAEISPRGTLVMSLVENSLPGVENSLPDIRGGAEIRLPHRGRMKERAASSSLDAPSMPDIGSKVQLMLVWLCIRRDL